MKVKLRDITRFRFTFAVALLAIPASCFFFLFEIDIFERFFDVSRNFETLELDEFIFLLALICLALVMDLLLFIRHKKKEREIEAAKLEALTMTMDKVHHIVNNSMNFLLLIYYKLEAGEALSEEDIKFFKTTIYDTSRAVGEIKDLEDTEIKFD